MIKFLKYNLEAIVFLCGLVVMVLELDGSRILAPYLGSSLYVWTSLIGIILGSLSLGYWIGGKFADKKPSLEKLAFVIFIAGVIVLLITFSKDNILTIINDNIKNIIISSVVSCLLIFAVPNILLGIVTPYATRLKLVEISKSGKTIGNIYAFSTLGSIAGTFLAGFWLIPAFGNTKVLLILAVILIFTSVLASFRDLAKIQTIFLIIVIAAFCFIKYSPKIFNQTNFHDIDTQYYRVIVNDNDEDKTGQPIRSLITDSQSYQSAMYLNKDDLVFNYTKYFHLVRFFNPDFKKSLMIGGGAYSFPKDYLKDYPNKKLDVVEIDPGITAIAKKYFNLSENKNLAIFHQDGRVFLNISNQKYDAIFIDAFRTLSPPFQLTSIEAINKINNSLNDNGVVIVNIVSSLDGPKSEFFKREYATYKQIYPQIFIFNVDTKSNLSQDQNIILVALKSKQNIVFDSTDTKINWMFENIYNVPNFDAKILTDDNAPVENMILKLI